MKKFVILLLCCGAMFAPAHARPGEPLSKLKERFGKPLPQSRKDQVSWLFEGEDGQLAYTVTFNAKGQSIAEGLKPVKYGRLPRENAQSFIQSQLIPFQDSKTTRQVGPGEKYTFAGKDYVCAEQEFIIVDDPNHILIVWTKSGVPSVIAYGPEMMEYAGTGGSAHP